MINDTNSADPVAASRKAVIPERVVGRLSLYRRLLTERERQPGSHVLSSELAAMACVTPAQVRQDILAVGYSGRPNRGYEVAPLVAAIGAVLDAPEGQRVALVGVGHLGRAIIDYFAGRREKLAITAAFDTDPEKTGRVTHGVRCHPVDRLPQVVAAEGIGLGIITVPVGAAQQAADRLAQAGVRGILNYAPVPIRVPAGVYLEQSDMTMALEKVAYFAFRNRTQEG